MLLSIKLTPRFSNQKLFVSIPCIALLGSFPPIVMIQPGQFKAEPESAIMPLLEISLSAHHLPHSRKCCSRPRTASFEACTVSLLASLGKPLLPGFSRCPILVARVRRRLLHSTRPIRRPLPSAASTPTNASSKASSEPSPPSAAAATSSD